MKSIFIVVIINLVCLGLIHNPALADEGTFTLCANRTYNIRYDVTINKIIIMCYIDKLNTPFHIVDPMTLEVNKTFNLNGFVAQVNSLGTGSSLLISVGENDGNRSTKEGKLIELDYATGENIRSMLYNQSLSEMTIDYSQENAYITTIGEEYNNPDKVLKVSLVSFQVLDEVIFGELTDDIEIMPDGSTIYVDSINIYPEHPSARVQGIGVFRTLDMTRVKRFSLPTPAGLMEMSDDGLKLFIASNNYLETDWGADLFIIDTQTDEITRKLRFYYNGMETATYSLAYCGQNNKLYCTAEPKTDYTYRRSNLILELDLTDYSYSFFTMGNNPLSRIALAEYDGYKRLFAIEESTPVVHWKDLP